MPRSSGRCCSVGFSGLLLVGLSAQAACGAALYQVRRLDGFEGAALNNAGQVAGRVDPWPSFALYNSLGPNAGTMERVDGPGGTILGLNDQGAIVAHGGIGIYTVGREGVRVLTPRTNTGYMAAINNDGLVAALGSTGGGVSLYEDGREQPLPLPPGAAWGSAQAINAAGVVVGTAYVEGGPHVFDGGPRAVVWDGGQAQVLPLPEGASGWGTDINDSGTVVGTYHLPSGSRAFSYRDGVLLELDSIGGSRQVAAAINDAGDIVGQATCTDADFWDLSSYRAFLHTNGRVLDLNTLIPEDLDLVLVSALDINNLGQILATGRDSRTYLLTPPGLGGEVAVPEPSVLTLMVTAIGAVALKRIHRRRRSLAPPRPRSRAV